VKAPRLAMKRSLAPIEFAKRRLVAALGELRGEAFVDKAWNSKEWQVTCIEWTPARYGEHGYEGMKFTVTLDRERGKDS
jgi:hypothetical protein